MDNDIKKSSRIFTEMIGEKGLKWSSMRCKHFYHGQPVFVQEFLVSSKAFNSDKLPLINHSL